LHKSSRKASSEIVNAMPRRLSSGSIAEAERKLRLLTSRFSFVIVVGMPRFPVLILLASITLLPLRGQTQAAVPPSIRVHGESLVSVIPDEAQIDIGIVSQASSAEAVSTNNTVAVNHVVEVLRSLLPAANINTVNLSVDPNFRYPKEGAPVIQGYTATNTIRVMLNKLDLLSPVISAATRAGASSINRLNFTLRADTERQARAQALGEAATQAAASASALASSLKLKLGRVLRIEEGQPLIVSPSPQIDLGKAQSTDMAPLSPGYIHIHANVNLEYEIMPSVRAVTKTPIR
jgi:hypothetical protein